VQICILDGRLFEENSIDEGSEEALESCILLTSNQGKGLLNPGPDEDLSDDKKVICKLVDGQVRRRTAVALHTIWMAQQEARRQRLYAFFGPIYLLLCSRLSWGPERLLL
jgi:hypothetical protein